MKVLVHYQHIVACICCDWYEGCLIIFVVETDSAFIHLPRLLFGQAVWPGCPRPGLRNVHAVLGVTGIHDY